MQNVPYRRPLRLALFNVPVALAIHTTPLAASIYYGANPDASVKDCFVGGAAGAAVTITGLTVASKMLCKSSYWKSVKDITLASRIDRVNAGEQVDLTRIHMKINMPPYPDEVIRASAKILSAATKGLFNSTRIALKTSGNKIKEFAALSLASGVATAFCVLDDQPKIVTGISIGSTLLAATLAHREFNKAQSHEFTSFVNTLNCNDLGI